MSSDEKGAVAAAPEPEDREGLDELIQSVPRKIGRVKLASVTATALGKSQATQAVNELQEGGPYGS